MKPLAACASARLRASSTENTRSMPMLMPTAGTSFPLNMPTSLSYLRPCDHASMCVDSVTTSDAEAACQLGISFPPQRPVILILDV